jgi:Na+/proline symporter
MMTYLSIADWIVICIYLVGIVTLGVRLGRNQRNTRDYFLGSKNLPWWSVGLSIVATETSALTIIGVPAIAYGGNITFIQMIIGYVIARIILAIVLVPHYLKGEIYSPYELLFNRFGRGARQTAGGFFLLGETLGAGVRVYVVCIPIQLMLGIPIIPALLLFVILSLIYCYVGGVKAVIWTDAVQCLLFLVGGLFTLWYIPTLIEGGLPAVLSTAHDNIWMGIIGATVLVMSSHGADQLIVQRVLACGTVREGRKALVLSAVLVFPLFLTFLLVGAFLWVYYQNVEMAIPIPETSDGIRANDFVYPIFMLTEVPQVLRGFLVVAILSAAMSSVSSTLTALASVSTLDFVKPLLGAKTESFYLRFSKHSTVAWAILLIGVGFLCRGVPFVLDAAFSLRGLTTGALLGAILLAVFTRQGRSLPIVTGMLAALIVMICIDVFPKWSLTSEFWTNNIGTTIYWPWYTLIGLIVMLTVTTVVQRLNSRNNTLPR